MRIETFHVKITAVLILFTSSLTLCISAFFPTCDPSDTETSVYVPNFEETMKLLVSIVGIIHFLLYFSVDYSDFLVKSKLIISLFQKLEFHENLIFSIV